ncbi:MAG: alpha/beta hydrolase [Gammaproteobacteria bacterium]|nr:alpha/beta hydrolase [Gammaproteobacteria bacterium]
MNDEIPKIDPEKLKELIELRVVLEIPGMDRVRVRKNVNYKTHESVALGLDVYSPPNADGPLPAVLFVIGYSDSAAAALSDSKLKEWGAYVSWGQLVAASGFVGVTYSTSEPIEDAKAALEFVREHAAELNVDPARIGIWAISGNGPAALSLLASNAAKLKFAVLLNTYMLDLDGDSTVAGMAKNFGFSIPTAAVTVDDLDSGTPMLVVRSGLDEVPGLNTALDRFVARAIEANCAITVINLPDAPHGFDTLHDTDESRNVIRQVLAFMKAEASR